MDGFQFSDISYLAKRKTLDPFSRWPGRKSNLHKDKENSCHLFPDSHGERDKFCARVKEEKNNHFRCQSCARVRDRVLFYLARVGREPATTSRKETCSQMLFFISGPKNICPLSRGSGSKIKPWSTRYSRWWYITLLPPLRRHLKTHWWFHQRGERKFSVAWISQTKKKKSPLTNTWSSQFIWFQLKSPENTFSGLLSWNWGRGSNGTVMESDTNVRFL